MELDLDTQWTIFQITHDINIYFKKLMIDMFLELIHLKVTPINKGF